MKTLKRSFVFSLFLLFICSMANAALVQGDLSATGDGKVTIDTDTGLKWLDLDLSVPLAIDSTNPFTIDGWQVATLAQVQTLFNNYFGSSITNGSRIPVTLEKAQEFVGLFGRTFDGDDGTPISWGRFQATDNTKAGHAIVRYDSYLSYLLEDNYHNAWDPNSFSGVFYVKPVPVPSAIWLLGSGILGLTGYKRGKKG